MSSFIESGKRSFPIKTDEGMMILPDTTFENCPSLDVLCVGGGSGQITVVDDPEVIEFFHRQGSTAKFITSVCQGSEFLAKAGLLQGYRAACHTKSQVASHKSQVRHPMLKSRGLSGGRF